MRKLLALVALLAILPSSARADGRTSLQAPYADRDPITQCQWIAAMTGLGTCTMTADPNPADGSILADAQIASPDSPAGAHTLPTWGQAIAMGAVYAGYHLDQPADSVTLTFTWHLNRLFFRTEGAPQLAWNGALAVATVEDLPCGCERKSVSIGLSPSQVGEDVTETISLHSQTQTMQGPTGPTTDYRPIPAGTFLITSGFEAEAGLIMTAGVSRASVQATVSNIVVDEVDAPPPPAQ